MSDAANRCQKCGTAIHGRAQYCVLCYSQLHMPCPRCTWRDARGRVHHLHDKKTKALVNCSYCNNERFILRDP